MGQQTLPPGFRFSPTDEELVLYYLKSKALGKNTYQATIANVDVYKFEPYDLPGKAALPSKDQEWYFFSAQDKKYSHTARINRTTKKGYWKATGKDRKVFSGSSAIGLKKTLIYYEGRAPNGNRTNWIMHEYRLDEDFAKKEGVVCVAVLCRIRKKGGPGPRNGEQYGAPILNNKLELEEDSMGKVDIGVDTNRQDDVRTANGGNVYNLTDQVEIWKQALANITADHSGIEECKEAGFPKMESAEFGEIETTPNEKGMVEGDPDLFAYLQSLSNESNMAPLYGHDGHAILSGDQYVDMQNPSTLFDSEGFSYLSPIWDADSHLTQNYPGSALEESEMLREMSNLINDGQGIVGGTGYVIQPTGYNVPLDGDYIEIDDIEPSLDGFVLRPSKHSKDSGRSEEQLVWSIADTHVETQKDLHSQGSAAQTSWPQTQACYGTYESAHFGLPQGEKNSRGGASSIPVLGEQHRRSGLHPSGFYSGAGDGPYVVESATRNYLSKHVSTYEVSKHEMRPAQLYYASSFTEGRKCAVPASNPPATPSTTAFTVKDKAIRDGDTLRSLPACPIGLPPLPRPPTNSRKDVLKKPPPPASPPLSASPATECSTSPGRKGPPATRASDRRADHENVSFSNRHRWRKVPPPASPLLSWSPAIKCNRSPDLKVPLATRASGQRAEHENLSYSNRHRWRKAPPPASPPLSSSPAIKCNKSPDLEDPPGTPASDQRTEHENLSYSNRHRWKAPFRVLVSRAKCHSLRTRLLELENGMRVKFNDKLSALGKPGPQFAPTDVDATSYDNLVQGLLAILCQMVAAMFIYSCLFWGFRMLVSRASSVSV